MSKVRCPEEYSNPNEKEFFDKLVAISLKYDKTQHEQALNDIDCLKQEAEQAKKRGDVGDMKKFMTEVKRQADRHKMDAMDSNFKKQHEEEKKAGTDQVSIAHTQPQVNPDEPYKRISDDDEGECTIGYTGQVIFYIGVASILGYIAYRTLRKNEQ